MIKHNSNAHNGYISESEPEIITSIGQLGSTEQARDLLMFSNFG